MAERLTIEVDIPTQQAVEQAQAVAGALGQMSQSIAEADQNATKVEASLKGVGNAAQSTAEQVTKTSTAIEKAVTEEQKLTTTTQELASATTKATEATAAEAKATEQLAQASTEAAGEARPLASAVEQVTREAEASDRAVESLDLSFRAVAGDMSSVAREATVVAGDMAEVSQTAVQLATTSQQAGQSMQEAGQRGGRGMHEASTETSGVSKATGFLAQQVGQLVGSYLGLQGIIMILRELEEQTRRVVEAGRGLGEKKLAFDQVVLPLALNLGYDTDEAGMSKTRKIALDFMGQTGATAEQAREELATAQSAGIDVSSGKGSGFDAAVVIGQFASRQRLQAETAGQLLKLASDVGVRDKAAAEKFVAQIEAGFKNTAISDPSKFYSSAVEAVAGRVAIGVPLEQAIGQLAASAKFQADASVAASGANIFSEVAAAQQASHAKEMGAALLKRGLITPQQMTVARAAVEQQAVKETQAENLAEQDRKAREARADLPEWERHERDEVQLAEQRAQRARGRAKPAAEEAARHARATLEDRIKEKRETVDAMDSRLRATRDELDKKRDELALGHLVRGLPRGFEEQAMYDMTEGMDQQQLEEFIGPLVRASQGKFILPQLGAEGRRARETAIAAVRSADAGEAPRAWNNFSRSDVAKTQRDEVARIQSELSGTAPGEIYANQVEKSADSAIEVDTAAGRAKVGFGETTLALKAFVDPDSNGMTAETAQRNRGKTAVAVEGLKAKYIANITWQRINEAKQRLGPQHQAAINEFINQKLHPAIDSIWPEAETPMRGDEALGDARTLARQWGELETTMEDRDARDAAASAAAVASSPTRPVPDLPSTGPLLSPTASAPAIATPQPQNELDRAQAVFKAAKARSEAVSADPHASAAQKQAASEVAGAAAKAFENQWDLRYHPGGDSAASPPQAATQPASDGGHAQVIHHHHYSNTYNNHTQHVGNLWAGPDDPMDLPGPLEDFG